MVKNATGKNVEEVELQMMKLDERIAPMGDMGIPYKRLPGCTTKQSFSNAPSTEIMLTSRTS
jgi:hypothetical protein